MRQRKRSVSQNAARPLSDSRSFPAEEIELPQSLLQLILSKDNTQA